MATQRHTATASTWDSFKPTLIKVLAEFKPETVMEWGPGVSTLVMQDFPSVKRITTVEHDMAWHNKWKDKFGDKVELILEEDMERYPLWVNFKNFDLYFVDGREREICLELCNGSNGIVILHDAERESYQPHIQEYKYIFMEDDGHTCVITNNDDYESRLERIFENSNTPSQLHS